MKSLLQILLTILVAAAVAFGVIQYAGGVKSNETTTKETAFARVMRTGVLRCGYWNWPPLLMPGKDGQKLTGIFYDFTEELGKALSLKIEWTQDVGFASFQDDLKLGKVDAVCGGVWPVAARGRVMEFSDPIFYIPARIYVRANDHRFDQNFMLLNDEKVTLGSMDGWATTAAAHLKFPKAKILSSPDTISLAEVYESLADGKVDAIANDVVSSEGYIKANPGKIRELPTSAPLDIFGNTIAVAKGEFELQSMLNTGIRDLTNRGVTDSIVAKYETIPNSLLRPNVPYLTGQSAK